ncbi:enzymatic polyprotein [Elysia marginata]|uniref:Enzymatic polyprotein n=1 Tax=Elysia marginata TaxID=1093978 RepID=A0AAV4HLD3_9GAST|nr:enzymatic polyprotein [Elysia marginata]
MIQNGPPPLPNLSYPSSWRSMNAWLIPPSPSTATSTTAGATAEKLLECCDETLRKDLSRTFTPLTSSDEQTLLEQLRSVAVRQENVMVARLELQQMKQDRDETARTFYARLKCQADVCQFKIKCTCGLENNYCVNMIRDTLITGLADDDIRLKVLGPSNQEMSLDETIRFIEAKDSGKRSASRIKPPSSASVDASSTYRQAEKRRLQPHQSDSKDKVTLCGHCGKAGHGRRRQDRMNHCPTFNHTCSKCNLPHQFESVCRKSRPARNQTTTKQDDDATTVLEALCYIESYLPPQTNVDSTITLAHHIYNSLCDACRSDHLIPHQQSMSVYRPYLPSSMKRG